MTVRWLGVNDLILLGLSAVASLRSVVGLPRRSRAALTTAVMMALLVTVVCPAKADEARVEACIAAAERGQELAKAGRLNAANEHFATCARADCPVAVQRDCVQFAAQSDAAMATIVVSVIDERGARVKSARLLVDGAALETANDDAPIRLEPGSHAIEAVTPGGQTATRIQLAPGERNRRVSLQLLAEQTAERRPIPTGAWVAGGVGLAGVVTFGVLGALGTSEVHDLRARCAPRCTQGDLDAATTKLVIGNGALVAGVLALAVATWLYIERPTRPVRAALAF